MFIASTNAATDGNWYMDLRATHHFTIDLGLLNSDQPFTKGDQVTVGNGKTIFISYIGHALIPAHLFPLSLTNAYHTPHII